MFFIPKVYYIWLIFPVLLIVMLVYIRLARRYNIVDKPNFRSSHSNLVINSGGIIFTVAFVLYVALYKWSSLYADNLAYFLLGMLLISFVSFIDDLKGLSAKFRLLVHFVAVSALLMYVNAYFLLSLEWLIMAYILIIGALNAYNFIDGINGITGSYALLGFATLLYVNQKYEFVDNYFILTAMIACLVFLLFNFRKNALIFTGDVGSMGVAFWHIGLIIALIIATDDVRYVLFLSVYGVDTILTIVHRLRLGHNIFQAHRLHLYQLLANEGRIPHLLVSFIYVILQLIINVFIIFTSFSFGLSLLISCLPLVTLYFIIKPILMRRVVS